jgi:hypothetical protein
VEYHVLDNADCLIAWSQINNILGAENVLEHHVLDYADCLIALSKPEEAFQKMSYINNRITDVDFR